MERNVAEMMQKVQEQKVKTAAGITLIFLAGAVALKVIADFGREKR